MKQTFTTNNIVYGLLGILIMILFGSIFPSFFDCKKISITCDWIQLSEFMGIILGLSVIIKRFLVPYFLSIKPQSQREQIEDELNKMRGSIHGTLPKQDKEKDKN